MQKVAQSIQEDTETPDLTSTKAQRKIHIKSSDIRLKQAERRLALGNNEEPKRKNEHNPISRVLQLFNPRRWRS